MAKTYIITGAGGHLGSNVAKVLIARNEKVRVLALPGDSLSALSGLSYEAVFGDITDKDALRNLFSRDDEARVVIHAAGIVSISSGRDKRVMRVNVNGTCNMLELSREYGVEKFVYVSSVHAIPEEGDTLREASRFEPNRVDGLYARSKAIASQLVLDAAKGGLPALIVQPSGIIGPGDFGRAHMTQMVIDYLDGRLSAAVKGGYDFVDVRDVAHGILLACERGVPGQSYILSGEYLSIPQLLDELHSVSGKRPVKTYLPMWLASATAPLAECFYKLLHEPPLFTRYSLRVLKNGGPISHEKATRELGYHPRSILITIRDTANWLIANGRCKRYRPAVARS